MHGENLKLTAPVVGWSVIDRYFKLL